MKTFPLLLPLLASVSSHQLSVSVQYGTSALLTPEQVHAAYHNNGVLHSHTQPDGSLLYFQDHSHLPHYYNMNRGELYMDYLRAMWIQGIDPYQSGLVNPYDTDPNSFNEYLLGLLGTDGMESALQIIRCGPSLKQLMHRLCGLCMEPRMRDIIKVYCDLRSVGLNQCIVKYTEIIPETVRSFISE
eukprot:GFUD01045313.1.p1 GENE.GFUD01045313.1~~GFUD01045313.1.p1  ORF type:complete len:186 (+),score=12.03 GFUD01045313.1:56-613(+)